jgi:hypothetical protein
LEFLSSPVILEPLRSTPPRAIPIPVIALTPQATPGPVVASPIESVADDDTTQSRTDSRRWTWAVALAAMFALAATIAFWPSKSMETRRTTATMRIEAPKTTATPATTATTAPTSTSDVKSVAMPTTGTIATPPSVKSNRVFADGKCVGQGGASIVVACGDRAVKIGSAGKVQHVAVPCGGEALVQPKW